MLQLFSYENNNVRVVIINDEPWFVTRDICNVLGIVETKTITERLDTDEQRLTPVSNETTGRSYDMSIINESGVYTAIIRSDKPEAKLFRKWITSEVLPSIRKTGSYTSQLAPVDPLAELRELTKSFMAMQSEINTKLLEDSKNFKIKSASHPGCYNIINSDNTDLNSAITAQQYLISKGLHNWDKRNTFSRRAANALRVGKQIEELPMYKNNVLYYPSDIGYLEETLSQLLGLN